MSVKSTKKMFNLFDFCSFVSHLLQLRGQESILIICTSNVQINVCPLFSFSCLLQNIKCMRISCYYTNLTIYNTVSHTVCVAGQSCIVHIKELDVFSYEI